MSKKSLYITFFTACLLMWISCSESGYRTNHRKKRSPKQVQNVSENKEEILNEEFAACAYSQWTEQEISRAATDLNVAYMTKQEKRVLFLCNLARIDGLKFANTFGENYLRDKTNSYAISLLGDLENIKNKTMLAPNENLYQTARFHAEDMGQIGKTGHDSSDGTSFSDRVRNKYKGRGAGECCSYGFSYAEDIVMHLLIDEGVPDLGHRHLVLNMGVDFDEAGVSIKPHKKYGQNCVIDFGQKNMK